MFEQESLEDYVSIKQIRWNRAGTKLAVLRSDLQVVFYHDADAAKAKQARLLADQEKATVNSSFVFSPPSFRSFDVYDYRPE